MGDIDVMSDSETEDFGGTDKDIRGQMVTRKVQDGGRVNFPDEYLDWIGANGGERVFIIVEEDGLRIIQADAQRLAATGVAEGMRMLFGNSGGD